MTTGATMCKTKKCKDISNADVLKFLAEQKDPSHVDGYQWCTCGEGYSMPTVQDCMPKGTPEKLQRAKMKQLIKRGLAEGCSCGCRGDYYITVKGLDYIADSRSA